MIPYKPPPPPPLPGTPNIDYSSILSAPTHCEHNSGNYSPIFQPREIISPSASPPDIISHYFSGLFVNCAGCCTHTHTRAPLCCRSNGHLNALIILICLHCAHCACHLHGFFGPALGRLTLDMKRGPHSCSTPHVRHLSRPHQHVQLSATFFIKFSLFLLPFLRFGQKKLAINFKSSLRRLFVRLNSTIILRIIFHRIITLVASHSRSRCLCFVIGAIVSAKPPLDTLLCSFTCELPHTTTTTATHLNN